MPLIFKVVKDLPREYRFELGSQIIRSGFSVVLNIAEGSGKSSDKDLNRFIDISIGSANEVLASMDVLKDNNFITETQFKGIYDKIYSICSQLGGFKKKLTVSRSVSWVIGYML